MLFGIPCTTWEFGLTHKVFGKPYSPKNPGIALLDLIKSSAILSNFNVVTPSFIYFETNQRVFETNSALSLMSLISSMSFIIPIIFISKENRESSHQDF